MESFSLIIAIYFNASLIHYHVFLSLGVGENIL
jgi:hypothetical protein